LSSESPLKDLTIFLSDTCFGSEFALILEVLLRGIVFALMLSCNVFMMSLFVYALQKQNSTLTVTALSTAANFVATVRSLVSTVALSVWFQSLQGCIGILFFKEVVSARWYYGALLCAVGSALISFSQTRFSRTD
jgi:uncharacterized membrane protein